jgi:hypothetical protein
MQMLEAPGTYESHFLMRADRISRLGNKWLGRLKLDHTIIGQLSDSQIGLFAEGFLGLDTMVGRLLPMACKPRETQTVVLYSSKEAGEAVYRQLVGSGHCESFGKSPEHWQVGGLLFSSVEGLKRLKFQTNPINSLILLDPTCMVHRARTMRTSNGRTHDRPQIIADFLADQVTNWIRPVFILMTTKRAAAVPTDTIARAFCFETFWFLDGPSIIWG